MNTTSFSARAFPSRSTAACPAFFWHRATLALAAGLAFAVSANRARADLLVLNAHGTGASILRLNPATGATLGTFSHENEGLYSMTATVHHEVFTNSNILGGYDLYRFTSGGSYRGISISGTGAGFDAAARGPDGNLYAIWNASGTWTSSDWRIARITGPSPATFVANGSGGMQQPTWMVFGPDGQLYVNDASAGILRFDGATGAPLGVFVPPGRGGLQRVARMLFGRDGRLYVTDAGQNAVLRFDASGAFVDAFVGPASGGLINPCGLAFGPDGHLCVASRGTRQILRYDGTTGAYLSTVFTMEAAGSYGPPNLVDLAFVTGTTPRDTVWFDDDLPAGAVAGTSAAGAWTWVTSGPAPFQPLGTRSHRAYAEATWDAGRGFKEHSFNFATEMMTVAPGESLFVHVWLTTDAGPQSEVMVSWCDGSWEHRAYWGADTIAAGQSSTNSRRYMGRLPSGAGGWTRLEVPAALVGLEGRTLQGISFSTHDLTATFDRVGKSTPSDPNLTDTVPPTVRLTAPVAGATVSGTLQLAAEAADDQSPPVVYFSVDDRLVGTKSAAPYAVDWTSNNVANGSHTVTAMAVDAAGNRTTSSPVTITVSNSSPTTPTSTVWFDDALPAGAQPGASGGDDWTWIGTAPAPHAGARAHQSAIASGLHEHYFNYASTPFALAANDYIYTWVYMDPANPPQELMLSFFDGASWEHRAYWGANVISYGQDGTPSRIRFGFTVPPVGQWTRLAIPANSVGLGGKSIVGMSFSLYGGRATWDETGKSASGGDVTPPTVRITAPSDGATVSGVVTISVQASDDSGLARVALLVDDTYVAAGGTSFTWDSRQVTNGTHTITASAADNAGNEGRASIQVYVNNAATGDTQPPVVSILEPANGATVTGWPYFRARATDNSVVSSIELRIDGAVVISRTGNGTAALDLTTQWASATVMNGAHSFSATATDTAGNQATASITLQVNNSGASGAVPWVNGALPNGASGASSGGDGWNWVTANPPSFAAPRAHQSNIASGLHEHYFAGATDQLQIFAGDVLYAYVYLDPANPPQEAMLSWNDGHWEHRAYWGANLIPYGTGNTNGRRAMGALPAAGQWVRLEVAAALVGLEGSRLQGMSFTLYGGRATWDTAGKLASTGDVAAPTVALTAPANGAIVDGSVTLAATAADNVGVSVVEFRVDGVAVGQAASSSYSFSWNTTSVPNGSHVLTAVARDAAGNSTTSAAVTVTVSNSATPPPTGEIVWVDDDVPGGAVAGGSGGDAWTWVTTNPAPVSGARAHQSALATGVHEHFFGGVTAPLHLEGGDTLLAYVYLDPANPPRELMLSWFSGNWEHRAYWGENLITYGTDRTASRFPMGALPPAGQWIRLEVPANAVGFTAAADITGMSFSLYDGRATWDRAGKRSTQSTTGDTTPPTAAILAPAPGATVSGQVLVDLRFTDNVSVRRIALLVDGRVVISDNSWNQPTLGLGVYWNSTTGANGSHALAAQAWDAAGNTTVSTSVMVTVNNPAPPASADTTAPTVALTAPANNATVSGNVTLAASATDNVGVTTVTFRLDGTAIGAVSAAPYGMPWNTTGTTNGSHALAAVASDAAGNQATSSTVIVSVNNATSGGAVIWMDSAVPASASTGASGGDAWTWVTSNPAPFAGTRVHQSALASGVHDHSFVGTTSPLQVFAGDTLFVYVYVDPANRPREIMLSFNDGTWEHRAYWGSNDITYGEEGTSSRRNLGALPAAGQWVRLEIPARLVGLEGRSVSGMSFTLVGGRATWDIAGKVSP